MLTVLFAILSVLLTPCDFLDFQFGYGDDVTAAGLRGQLLPHFARCMRGPCPEGGSAPDAFNGCAVEPGCSTRFDMDGNRSVDLSDFARLNLWMSRLACQEPVAFTQEHGLLITFLHVPVGDAFFDRDDLFVKTNTDAAARDGLSFRFDEDHMVRWLEEQP